jgi:N-methylhydantoinase B
LPRIKKKSHRKKQSRIPNTTKTRISPVDSTTFGFLWDRLISITDEAYGALIRSSFSPIVREALDATCQLFDSRGRSIAQAWVGPPSFIGTLPTTLKEIQNIIPKSELKPGDVLATNDPWIGTGQVNDISILLPIFAASHPDEIIAYAGAVSHLPDIGGQVWSATAGDVFEEGLRIPPVKLVKKGEFDRTMLDVIRANVRLPAQTIGDISSDISSVRTMERLLKGLLKEYNLKDLELISERIISQSKAALEMDIQKLPSGVYTSEVKVEGFDVDHNISCKVKIQGKSMKIDFEGTSPKSSYGINSPFVYTRAYTVYAAKCVVSPAVPNNQGTMDVFEVTAPEGSILNPRPPAACGARHITGWHAPIAVWRALANVVPDRVVADTGLPSSCTIKGTDSKGRTFVAITVIGGGGMGARPDSDGLNSTGIPTVTSHISAEVLESTTPLLVEELKLIPDSGGPGKFRGGLGASYTIRNLSGKSAKVAFIGNKFHFAPSGLSGGLEGTMRRALVNGKEVSPMGMYILTDDGTITMENAGSGGFYDPKKRDPALVEEDLRNGFISKRIASEVYGYRIAD